MDIVRVSAVTIDPAALTAEADQVARDILPDPAPGSPPADATTVDASPAAQPSAGDVLAGYQVIAEPIVAMTFNGAAPNWHVTPAETSKLADAIARALVLWFPDGFIPPKYLALLVVAHGIWEIAAARRDPSTGKFKPARLDPPKPETRAAAREATAAP